MYSSLSQFKSYLWISSSDTSNDDTLTLLLETACNQINRLCGVDSFDQQTFTQNLDVRKIYVNTFWYNIFLKNKPVQSITKIGWNEYSGVKWTDYMVANDRRIIFQNFDYESKFGFIPIEYVAWYDRAKPVEWSTTTIDELPADLKMMEMMLACGWLPEHLRVQYMVWITSYHLWDETITLWWKTTSKDSEDLYFSFRMMLDKFKNFNLAI